MVVFALSLPFWVIGAVTSIQLVPGLPVSALMVVCPATAAVILLYTALGTAGVRALLQRSFDYQRISAKVWYAPIMLLMPGVMVVTYGVMRVLCVPLPHLHVQVPAALVMGGAFFIGALGEERAGRATSLTRCKRGGARSPPAYCWGWSGPCGTWSRWCRWTARRPGSPVGACSRWRHGC
jgi:hypothetical protein